MPTVSESVEAAANLDHNRYEPVLPVQIQHPMPSPDSPEEARNPMLRTPLPPIAYNSDSLRQFYGGSIPQTRTLPVNIRQSSN